MRPAIVPAPLSTFTKLIFMDRPAEKNPEIPLRKEPRRRRGEWAAGLGAPPERQLRLAGKDNRFT